MIPHPKLLWVYLAKKYFRPKLIVSHGLHGIQLTLIILDHILIYNNHIMAPQKEHPPPLLFVHPMVDTILVENMIANINTIHIVAVIISDVKSQKLHLAHRTSNSIKQ